MSEAPYRFHLGLELGRYLVFTVVGVVLFLFFTLFLDVVSLVIGGGWNPLLGEWPIFSGTVSAVVYGSKASVVTLILSFGLICRLVAGPVTPVVIAFLQPKTTDQVDTGTEKEL
jgi:hypothetical protein